MREPCTISSGDRLGYVLGAGACQGLAPCVKGFSGIVDPVRPNHSDVRERIHDAETM